MKYLVPISLLFLLCGILLKEEYFILNIYDTYYVTSYLYPAICIAVLLNFLYLTYRFTNRKRKRSMG